MISPFVLQASSLVVATMAIGLPVWAAYVWWRRAATETGASLAWGLAIPSGLGAAALLYHARLLVPGASDLAYGIVDTGVWSLILAIGWRTRTPRDVGRDRGDAPLSDSIGRPNPAPRFAVVALAIVGVSIAAGFVVRQVRDPYGGSDAIAFWNRHAAVLSRTPDRWRDHLRAYATDVTAHSDYPLLLPASVARVWTIAGSDRAPASPLVAGVFLLALPLILGGVLARVRDERTAVFGVLVMFASPYPAQVAGWQFADVPFAVFLLGTSALLVLHERRPSASILPWTAGFLAGCAAYTKNEGLLWLAACGAVWGVRCLCLADRRRAWRSTAALVGGLLPGLLMVAWFKLSVAPPNDLVAHQSVGGGPWERIGDIDRWATIARWYLAEALSLAEVGAVALLVHLVALGRVPPHVDRPVRAMLPAMLGLMLAGYFAVYLVTPWDLEWHLGSSAKRLFVQLWPTGLLWYGLSVGGAGSRAEPTVFPRLPESRIEQAERISGAARTRVAIH